MFPSPREIGFPASPGDWVPCNPKTNESTKYMQGYLYANQKRAMGDAREEEEEGPSLKVMGKTSSGGIGGVQVSAHVGVEI